MCSRERYDFQLQSLVRGHVLFLWPLDLVLQSRLEFDLAPRHPFRPNQVRRGGHEEYLSAAAAAVQRGISTTSTTTNESCADILRIQFAKLRPMRYTHV